MRFIGLSLAVGMFFCMMQLATAQSRTDFGASVNRAPTREFLQPFNLMPNRQQNIVGNQFGCGGGGVSVKGGEVRVDLKIEYSHYGIWNPDTGQNDEVYLRTYNDCPIGPTLTLHPGDTLLLNLKNNLPADSTARCPEPLNTPNCFNSANMHTHGLHVSPAGNSDNVLITVDPQTTFPYRYDIPSNHPSGTFWYHSHRHGSTALSVASGMEGVLIVKGNRKYQDAAQNDGVVDIDTILHDKSGHEFPERILLFQQIAYACFDDSAFQTLIQNRETGQWECPTGRTGVVENYKLQFGFAARPNRPNEEQDVWITSGRYTAINGKVQPIFQARAGEIERWRMVHGGVRDTINLQVVKASGELIARSELDDLSRNLQSRPRDQLQAFVNQSCGGAGSTDDVLQYEFAVDGLTRHKIWPKSLNVLNPGQRSDALVFFKEPGVYCLLDQRGENTNTIIREGGRIGSKSRQLLGIVVVKGGEVVSLAPDTFIKQTLTGANADLPQSVRTKLEAFDISDFAFFPPSQPHGGDLTHATIAKHPTALFVILRLPLAPGAQLPPNQPSPNPDIAAMVGMVKNDKVEVRGSTVLAYDHDTTYQAKLGTADEWTLGVTTSGPGTVAAPHVFHIHVNPFQIMDIKDTTSDQSIYDANGKCKPIYLEPTAPDPANPSGALVPNPVYSPEYCDQFYVFRDSMFVKENFLVTARTAYDDFIGEFVMHCHILDHEDQGMMQNVRIVSSDNYASKSFHAAQGNAGNRVALVIGNATYPDDNQPLAQPIRDARAIVEELRRADFEVITGEDVSRQKLRALLGSFKAKIKQGSTAFVFFSGYGIQNSKQSYIIPVDAQIWTEGEVKRDGISVESILADINAAGATVKLVIIDAARRNPFERRFRGLSIGLAPLTAPAGALAIYSAAPDKAVNDSKGANSLFVTELLKEMRTPGLSAEAIFNNTQKGVSRASKNEQVPWVSSSLVEEFYFGKVAAAAPPSPPSAPSPPPSPPHLASPIPTPPPPPVEDDQIISELNEAIGRNPRDPDLYYKRGQVFAERRKFALATEDFGQAIRLNPNDTEALNNRCFTRAVLGQLDAALSDCNEAIRLRPKYADALDSRGLTRLKLGQFDQAIADYDAALRLSPKMASALYGRGKAKIKKGDAARGNADIRTAKSIDSTIDRELESYGVP